MRESNKSIWSDGSLGASGESDAFELRHLRGYAVQAVYTGAPVGTLTLQVSNDNSSPTNWTDASSESISAAGSTVFNHQVPQYKFIRLKYVRTSGTGTINARVHAKGF